MSGDQQVRGVTCDDFRSQMVAKIVFLIGPLEKRQPRMYPLHDID